MKPNKVLSLIVNGSSFTLPLIPGETLAELLRDRLGLTGTKIGCNEAECGACTVLVNGEAVLSCAYPAARAEDKEITTIEGLAPLLSGTNYEQVLHPVQKAFVAYGAVQCGFCTPGQIMTVYALLEHNPNPPREEIREALKGVLCRCGCYPAIERAILAAADSIQHGTPITPPSLPLSMEDHKEVGKIQNRPDAFQKVTGKAKYTDDLTFEAMLYGRVKRAEVPHAILRHVDVSLARALPGVRAILSAENLPGNGITAWSAQIGRSWLRLGIAFDMLGMQLPSWQRNHEK